MGALCEVVGEATTACAKATARVRVVAWTLDGGPKTETDAWASKKLFTLSRASSTQISCESEPNLGVPKPENV